MQKREKVLSAIAVSSAVFFVINQFVCAEKPQPPARPAPAVARKKLPAAVRTTITNAELEKRLKNWEPLVTYDTWGRNPFTNAIEFYADSLADTLQLRLKGIAWRNGEPLVLIGDKIMRPGDRDGDFQLLKVYHDRVIAQKNGEILTLFLDPKSTDQRNHAVADAQAATIQ